MKISLREHAIHAQIDLQLVAWNKDKGRGRSNLHMHLSTLIQPDYCHRQNVLTQHFREEPAEIQARLCNIFLQGWGIHELVQDQLGFGPTPEYTSTLLARAFKEQMDEAWAGVMGEIAEENLDARIKAKYQLLVGKIGNIAIEVETNHYCEELDISFTPDAIVRLDVSPAERAASVVFEFKGYKQEEYRKIVAFDDPLEHKEFQKACVQANMYMHMLNLKWAVILVENKNTQEYITVLRQYDPLLAAPCLERLEVLEAHRQRYRTSGKLPRRLPECAEPTSRRAMGCPQRDACFGSDEARAARRLVNVSQPA